MATGLPEDAFQNDALLVASLRADHVEVVHRGVVAVAAPDSTLIAHAGDPDQPVFMRSSAKPFQAMALVTSGAAESLDLSEEDLAIACASHSGEPEHVQRVLALLSKADLGPELLQCGTHPPLSAEAAAALAASAREPSAVHNNCSGKHAGMLVTSKVMKWPLDSYRQADHPLQRLNREAISEFTDVALEAIQVGIDGCGVPAFRVPVRAVAVAFSRLASGAGVSPRYSEAAAEIRGAMMAFPHLVGGTGRFDTDLMTAARRTVVSKGGAQGGQGIGVLSPAMGVGIKISDGSSTPIPRVTLKTLADLGVEDGFDGLERYQESTIRNHAGTAVGSTRSYFTLVERP